MPPPPLHRLQYFKKHISNRVKGNGGRRLRDQKRICLGILFKIIDCSYGYNSSLNGSKSIIVLQKFEVVKHQQGFLTLDEIHICMYIYFPIFQMS